MRKNMKTNWMRLASIVLGIWGLLGSVGVLVDLLDQPSADGRLLGFAFNFFLILLAIILWRRGTARIVNAKDGSGQQPSTRHV